MINGIRQFLDRVGVGLVLLITLLGVILYFLIVEVGYRFMVMSQVEKIRYWLVKNHIVRK